MAGGLVALAHRFVGDQYKPAVDQVGVPARFLFSGRDEGRDKHAAVGGGIKPFIPMPLTHCGRVGAVNHHLLLERAVEQLEVAVRLIVFVSDFKSVDASEKFGMGSAHGKAPRVVAQVMIQRVERTVGLEYLVVEAFGEDAVTAGSVVDLDFEGGYVSAQYFIGLFLHEQQQMQMVGHDGIL